MRRATKFVGEMLNELEVSSEMTCLKIVRTIF
jgi:hypothetical protein